MNTSLLLFLSVKQIFHCLRHFLRRFFFLGGTLCCCLSGLFRLFRFFRFCSLYSSLGFLRFFRLGSWLDVRENSHAKRRNVDRNGIGPVICLLLFGLFHSWIRHSRSAEFYFIAIENFFVFSSKGHAHRIFFSGHRCKVADNKKGLFLFLCLSCKNQKIFIGCNGIDPLKSFRIIVHLIQGRLALIQSIQRLIIFCLYSLHQL